MAFDVLVTREKNERYTARVLLLPDIVRTGDTEEEALEQVRTAIVDLRSSSRIVHVDIQPFIREEADPWLQYAGRWADDPDWEVFQAELQAFRREMDGEAETDSP